ncbi:hypothetical protein V8C26DRAFT_401042 [Trichoderma gracile]
MFWSGSWVSIPMLSVASCVWQLSVSLSVCPPATHTHLCHARKHVLRKGSGGRGGRGGEQPITRVRTLTEVVHRRQQCKSENKKSKRK